MFSSTATTLRTTTTIQTTRCCSSFSSSSSSKRGGFRRARGGRRQNWKRKTAANASSDLNDNDPEAENDDETTATRRTNNSAMRNSPPESVAWLPPLDRLSFAEDDDDENDENNLSMRNERTYESKSGESAYTIARKDGESTIDDENEEEFIEYKEKVERVQDVMEFISKNKNWLKIARTQKMREYRAKTGLVDMTTAMKYAGVRDEGVLAKFTPEKKLDKILSGAQVEYVQGELGEVRKDLGGIQDPASRARALEALQQVESIVGVRAL